MLKGDHADMTYEEMTRRRGLVRANRRDSRRAWNGRTPRNQRDVRPVSFGRRVISSSARPFSPSWPFWLSS